MARDATVKLLVRRNARAKRNSCNGDEAPHGAMTPNVKVRGASGFAAKRPSRLAG